MGIVGNMSEMLRKLLYTSGLDISVDRFLLTMVLNAIGFGIAGALVLSRAALDLAVIAFASVFVLFLLAVYVILALSAGRRVSQMEDLLPDFLTLMSSNLRSGLTPDRALVVSARREFGPLTKEIDRAAKLAIAGRPFDEAFQSIGEDIPSVAFTKSIRLIVEGIKAGGNLASLLENTASDLRRFTVIRNEVNSNVMIYRLFLFVAAAFGAPLLYGAANFLISVIYKVKSLIGVDAGMVETAGMSGLGLLKSTSSLSPEATYFFILGAITVTSFFSSLAAAAISSGKTSDGLKYFPILLLAGLSVFFGIKFLLESVFSLIFFV